MVNLGGSRNGPGLAGTRSNTVTEVTIAGTGQATQGARTHKPAVNEPLDTMQTRPAALARTDLPAPPEAKPEGGQWMSPLQTQALALARDAGQVDFTAVKEAGKLYGQLVSEHSLESHTGWPFQARSIPGRPSFYELAEAMNTGNFFARPESRPSEAPWVRSPRLVSTGSDPVEGFIAETLEPLERAVAERGDTRDLGPLKEALRAAFSKFLEVKLIKAVVLTEPTLEPTVCVVAGRTASGAVQVVEAPSFACSPALVPVLDRSR